MCIISPSAFSFWTKKYSTVNNVTHDLHADPAYTYSSAEPPQAPDLAKAPALGQASYSSLSLPGLEDDPVLPQSGKIRYSIPGRDDLGYCEVHFEWLLSYMNPTWRDSVVVDSSKPLGCWIQNNDSQIVFTCTGWPLQDGCK